MKINIGAESIAELDLREPPFIDYNRYGKAEPHRADLSRARYLSAADAADYLGQSVGALYKLVHRRQIPFVKRGRRLMFDRLALDEWIGRRAVPVEELPIKGAR